MSSVRSRRIRRMRAARYRRGRNMRILGVCALVVLGGGALAAGLVVNSVASELRKQKVQEIRLGQNTRVYDRDHHLLGIIASTQNRTEVRSRQIPKFLKNATVAIEDKRFYEHHGVDYYRLVGALVHNLVGGHQGGSTITMQLARNLMPGGANAPRTFKRKIQEAYLANKYEDKYTKDQILTRYLNSVFYGHNAVGVEAASLTYFRKDVWRINLEQAALLAGLPQAPSAYDPFTHRDVARARRNSVLQQMADQGYITQDQSSAAQKRGLELRRGNAYSSKPQGEPYFFDYVRQRLIDSFGPRAVQRGGFTVNTTIDRTLQTYARDAITSNLGLPDDPVASIVMIDAQKGYIRAMQSSQPTTGATSQFNYATQAKRQAGSTFKVFTLTRAIELGHNPYTTDYVSRQLDFHDPRWGLIQTSTYSHGYRGRISIEQATLTSDNTVYMQMALDEDPNTIVDLAYRMGIPRSRDLPRYPSITLGTGSVTPLDMATAYAPLSNGGWRVQATGVQSIKQSNGQALAIPRKRTPAISDGVAYEVTKVLRANVAGGTGIGANIATNVAGKTGTTEEFSDAWFVGYTPCYVTAVWMGYPNTSEHRNMTSVHGRSVNGGSFPTSIWASFMRKVLADPRYKCDRTDYPLPQHPVVWQPFSSAFTRMPAPVTSSSTPSTTPSTGTNTNGGGVTRTPSSPSQPPPPATSTPTQAQPPPPTPTPPTTPAVPTPPATTPAAPTPTSTSP
ncbi:MAG: transglycosylase domain-containing protein [Thermoleophilia bacterium]